MNIFHKVTLKVLKQNRTRTLVTIVGIILSASMFTAVTTSISSLRNYLIQSTIYQNGNWHGAGFGLSTKEKEQLVQDQRITDSVSMEVLGYSRLEDSTNEDKPFLCVYGIQSDFTDMMPVHLVQGRMPKHSGEILLPEHLETNGGVDWEIGSSLRLELGNRQDDTGKILLNQEQYLHEDLSQEDASYGEYQEQQTLTERFVPKETRTYTVVGIYERPSFESYQAPGYTALTIGEGSGSNLYDIYLRLDSGRKTVHVLKQMFDPLQDITYKYNYDLLRLYGYSGESSYNRVLFNLGIILIVIIMFGSISLIYNAFSISVSERTKQFGLLASIGATRRQLTGSVLFEALLLGIIGIPLGILSGLVGIGITFHFVQDMVSNILGFSTGNYQMARLSMIFGPAKNVSLSLSPSQGALAAAGAVSLLTVIISAYLPARRALKKSAIEAIRQTDDISIPSKKLKTSRLMNKIFGFEGLLATKNYKRNRKKYRATVISLFLSIVLFISASSLCAYLTASVGAVLNESTVDLAYYLDASSNKKPNHLLEQLSQVNGVTSSAYASHMYFNLFIKTSSLSKEFQNYNTKMAIEQQGQDATPEYVDLGCMLVFLQDQEFRTYLKELGLTEDAFFQMDAPLGIVEDSLRLYLDTEKKYYNFPVFKNNVQPDLDLYLTRIREGYDFYGKSIEDNNDIVCLFFKEDSKQELNVPIEEACLKVPLAAGAVTQQAPALFSDHDSSIRIFYPYSMLEHVFAGLEKDVSYYEISDPPLRENYNTELLFQCEDHNSANKEMTKLLIKNNLSTASLTDFAASAESERSMITVINIFSYGFIILISLIAAANVFNTISTNINLRRREFAMLKSIGMTPEAFSKMMNFECLLYGFKGILYGLPVSFLVTWMIYRSISEGLEMPFFIPWYSIAIAVGSVFLVVFITMIYSMRRIRKENILDALKNENL